MGLTVTTPCICWHTTLWNINAKKNKRLTIVYWNKQQRASEWPLTCHTIQYTVQYGHSNYRATTNIIRWTQNRWGTLITNLRKVYWQVCQWNKKFKSVTIKNVVVLHTLCAWPPHCYKMKKVHQTAAFLLVTLPNIHWFKTYFSLVTCTKFAEDRCCSSRDMLANKQTDRQTRSSQYSAALSGGGVTKPKLSNHRQWNGYRPRSLANVLISSSRVCWLGSSSVWNELSSLSRCRASCDFRQSAAALCWTSPRNCIASDTHCSYCTQQH